MIIIKNHKKAIRCELCHQSDYFDAENNFCSRCINVQSLIPTIITNKNKTDRAFYKKQRNFEEFKILLQLYGQWIVVGIFFIFVDKFMFGNGALNEIIFKTLWFSIGSCMVGSISSIFITIVNKFAKGKLIFINSVISGLISGYLCGLIICSQMWFCIENFEEIKLIRTSIISFCIFSAIFDGIFVGIQLCKEHKNRA